MSQGPDARGISDCLIINYRHCAMHQKFLTFFGGILKSSQCCDAQSERQSTSAVPLTSGDPRRPPTIQERKHESADP
ncbi:hypothetical protein PUN4_530063 [Paraburkholderia unamae]|nr:hypothetical protein PUN4_530063 [Paraburkholderia unamae]